MGGVEDEAGAVSAILWIRMVDVTLASAYSNNTTKLQSHLDLTILLLEGLLPRWREQVDPPVCLL